MNKISHPEKEPGDPSISTREKEIQKRVEKIFGLVEKINETNERINFPGVDASALERAREQEECMPPGFCVPEDTIVKMCELGGIKIVADEFNSGNVFVIPGLFNNGRGAREHLSFPVFHLNIKNIQDANLRELVQIEKDKNKK